MSATTAPPATSSPRTRIETLIPESELCQRFGIHRATIHRLRTRRRNPIPFFKVGARVFFCPVQVDLWLERCSVNGKGKKK